ncbi:hypothetical protein [Sulfurimonas sp.]
MANPEAAIERHIGGGKAYFSNWNGTAYDAEIEIGEVQGVNLKLSPSYTEARSRDTGVSKVVDKTLSDLTGTLSFTTQNVNKENMAMAMLGELTTETFAIGDTLPDGTVAVAEVILPVIIGGKIPRIEGKMRVVVENISGDFNPVLEVPLVVLTPSGDIRDYFSDKHATISFDGEITEVAGEYFKEYQIPKA